jgi:hypothetical protein
MMKIKMPLSVGYSGLILVLAGCAPQAEGGAVDVLASAVKAVTQSFADASGQVTNLSVSGNLDTTGAFFQSLGTNGRSCGSCHLASDAWGLSAAHAQQIFDSSNGTDPLFRPVDGAVSPEADVSTLAAQRAAYALLLSKGLIRVGMPVPANAEFAVVAIDDPYHAASATLVNCYRRPPPSTNLGFLTTVMWDGREMPFGTTMDDHLLHQALDATLGHAQASAPPTTAQLRAIVDFEEALFSAQTFDNDAGNLDAKQGNGGPSFLSTVPFHVGINDVLGKDPGPNPQPFNPVAMTLYDNWQGAPGGGTDGARAAVQRGQVLFNTKPIAITGVAGLNDDLGLATINGTCTSCHDTPDVGNHSVALPIDIGLTDQSRRTADMPLYTLKNLTTEQIKLTTDPGRALVTGKWKDIGKFKGPILRGLPARAPYFHNGSAATLDDVVTFYNSRFAIGFTAQEHADLLAFLKTL